MRRFRSLTTSATNNGPFPRQKSLTALPPETPPCQIPIRRSHLNSNISPTSPKCRSSGNSVSSSATTRNGGSLRSCLSWSSPPCSSHSPPPASRHGFIQRFETSQSRTIVPIVPSPGSLFQIVSRYQSNVATHGTVETTVLHYSSNSSSSSSESSSASSSGNSTRAACQTAPGTSV